MNTAVWRDEKVEWIAKRASRHRVALLDSKWTKISRLATLYGDSGRVAKVPFTFSYGFAIQRLLNGVGYSGIIYLTRGGGFPLPMHISPFLILLPQS